MPCFTHKMAIVVDFVVVDDKQTVNGLRTRTCYVKVKGKVFPYSLPSVGPGADPGVQAVSPQLT